MTFWQIFVRVFPSRPLIALQSMWWQITGRKVRARNRLRAAGRDLPFVYAAWIREHERADEVRERAPSEFSQWDWLPAFSILLIVEPNCSKADLDRSIGSVRRQVYPHWSLHVTKGSSGLSDIAPDDRTPLITENGALAAALRAAARNANEYLVPIRSGNELSSSGLFRFAETIRENPAATVIYGDHDELDPSNGRTAPWFKPSWNEEMFLAKDFMSNAVAIRSEVALALVNQLTEEAEVYDLLLAATQSEPSVVVHVPHIVAHLKPANSKARVDVVARHVAAAGATTTRGPFESVKVTWPLPAEKPLVSIIVPTKDKLELLRPCVSGILSRTTYAPFEILVVDNGSVEAPTKAFLANIEDDPRVRVLPYPRPYNYSAINNYAVGKAKGDYVCLLNNDTEVLEAEWLTELMRYAVRPDVGAVGAKLLYPDQTIQHAGVVIGIGGAAGHAHRNLPNSDPGYFAQPHVAQFVSAVTAACLVVRKEKFLDVGGLDEQALAVAFNDVDLCLKLDRAGWRNVYVPHAVLLHHESKSRGKDHSRRHIDRFRGELKTLQERWGTKNYEDPQFNPNLDRSSETFLIRL